MKKTIRLKKNQALPEDLFTQNLSGLEIFGDSFCEVTESFALLHHLTSLSIISKNLASIHPVIFELPQLKQLKIKHGLFNELPEIEFNSPIKTLFITDSKLESIPESIYKLESLEILVLSSNQLTSLPKNLSLLKNLRRLVIDQNKIEHLHLERANFPRLNHLSIDGNPLNDESKQNIFHEFGLQL